ncbi:MAG: site-2 protease family protein [Candidatus Yanofskybacteria bacterium CG10_big_fil_rev_8_21_14_0_10_37_15]|uniref:Site-2 protease family protein n=1 Tax=Candidatus Yanofskybacteria bacterium CG10_big_fil_rev_8_21_14_0_10_37_15 TaxID=1975097 RepID=A0A2H0R6C1_9BACT|nr:MAG: site-2 protease family protein [Candidatus Yanofskybacteria bacterium CG10_big_fil_rev_8_21_14_0_10_37_15]
MDLFLLPIFQIIVLLFSVVIHEVSHGLMANSLGDPTAKNLGRLTLNPIKHLDAFGSVILPLFLFFVRSPFIVGYAKPVPYIPENLRDKKYGPAKVAIAGPASNLFLAFLFGITLRFLPDIFISPLVPQLLSFIIILNLVLAIFNLFPIPPLDGHWLLMTFLPSRFIRIRRFMYQYSLILLIIFLLYFFPLIFPIVGWMYKIFTGLSI